MVRGESWEDALQGMRGLLALTDAYPDLLPAAPDAVEGNLPAQSYQRVMVEGHLCLRCGMPAAATYLVARRDHAARRWFDTCNGCEHLLRVVVSEDDGMGLRLT